MTAIRPPVGHRARCLDRPPAGRAAAGDRASRRMENGARQRISSDIHPAQPNPIVSIETPPSGDSEARLDRGRGESGGQCS